MAKSWRRLKGNRIKPSASEKSNPQGSGVFWIMDTGQHRNMPNNGALVDGKKLRSFLAPLFVATKPKRYAPNEIEDGTCTTYW
jgi:hypothetical protein